MVYSLRSGRKRNYDEEEEDSVGMSSSVNHIIL